MIIPAGFSQHTLIFAGADLPYGAVCTYGVDHSGTSDITAEGQDARDAWIIEMLPVQHVDVTLTALLVKRGPNATGQSYVAASSSPGTLAGSGLSPNVSLLLRKTTALGGRKGRGRMFMPGLAEANVQADGGIDPGYLGTVQTAINDWAAALVLNGMGLVLLHSDATAPTPITLVSPDGTAATQRRRLRR